MNMTEPRSDATHDCVVFVPSCDPYADLWVPFFHQLWKHWPDCPFPVVLGANNRSFPDARVQTLRSSHGTTWTDRVREQLASLSSTYVLLWLEDFLLQSDVRTEDVLAALAFARTQDATVVRLVPRPPADVPVASAPQFGVVRPGAPYRVSTQAAIWHRERLIALMRDGESIWEFELAAAGPTPHRPGTSGSSRLCCRTGTMSSNVGSGSRMPFVGRDGRAFPSISPRDR
jgi:hypothetical protein